MYVPLRRPTSGPQARQNARSGREKQHATCLERPPLCRGAGDLCHARICPRRLGSIDRHDQYSRSFAIAPPVWHSGRAPGDRVERRRRLDSPRAACRRSARRQRILRRRLRREGRTWRASRPASRRCDRTTSPATTRCSRTTPRAARTQRPILIGVSEGAGLSVLAATDPRTKTAIAGVIGLGLPDLNELGWRWKDSLIYVTHSVPERADVQRCGDCRARRPAPLAAIHSTHDEFVPLAEVQRVLDAAKEPKRLWIVNASDHRFSDNLDGVRPTPARGDRLGRAPARRGEGIRSVRAAATGASRRHRVWCCSSPRSRCCGSSCARSRGTS